MFEKKIECFVEQTFKNIEKTIPRSEVYIYTPIDDYTNILIRAMIQKGMIIKSIPFGIGERHFIKNANFEQTKKGVKDVKVSFKKKVIANKVFNQ
jgi:hypothetical protein